jgi:hypothetical protein
MPVTHVVLIKVKADAAQEKIDACMKAVMDLKSKISVIQAISCGENFTDRGKGFTHGIYVKLGSRADLPTYLEHPDHVALKTDHLIGIMEDLLVVDFDGMPKL